MTKQSQLRAVTLLSLTGGLVVLVVWLLQAREPFSFFIFTRSDEYYDGFGRGLIVAAGAMLVGPVIDLIKGRLAR